MTGSDKANGDGKVSDGKVVSFRYTLTVRDGVVIDQSGDDPMPYLHGAGNIVPGLEKQMTGRAPGDKFRAVVSAEEGYGEREGEPQKVPRSAFPDAADLEVGMQVIGESPDGEEVPLWVTGISESEIEIDENHPLAGETLTFEIELVGVRPATKEELAHGHPHEPGGHHHH